MSREDRKRQRKARRAETTDTPSPDLLQALVDQQRAELSRCWTEIAGLREERDRLKAQGDRMRVEHAAALEEASRTVHAGLRQMQKMQADIDLLSADLDESHSDFERVRNLADTRQNRIAHLERRERDLIAEAGRLAQERDEARKQTDAGLLQVTRTLADKLERALADVKRVPVLEAELAASQRSATQLRADLAYQTRETERWRQLASMTPSGGGGLDRTVWRELLQLAHPDKHPPERQALANRATQWLTANKPA